MVSGAPGRSWTCTASGECGLAPGPGLRWLYRASWTDERIVTGTLADLSAKVRPLRLRRTALILVGRVLAPETFDDSALYDATHHLLLRPRKKRRATG